MTRAALLGLVLGGCFSGQDFDVCTKNAHCGPGGVCAAGQCTAGPADAAVPLDARVPFDAAPPQVIEVDGVQSFTVGEEGAEVHVRNVIVPPAELGTPVQLRIRGDVIIIEGSINADGAGWPGGGGGGGGVGGFEQVALTPAGGRGGGNGQPGQANVGPRGGAGGPGGRSGNVSTPATGGLGGVAGAEINGKDGDIGYLVPPHRNDDPAVCENDVIHFGNGGGGGGGGAGAGGGICVVGGGGGGGGGGGAGGGVILIEADRRVIIRGELLARGLPGTEAAGGDGGASCIAGAEEPCEETCDSARDAFGGDGGEPGRLPQLGGTGGEAAGNGGTGGGGSGGQIRIQAPEIIWEAAARVDVSGSRGADNGGMLRVVGQQDRALAPIGPRFHCTASR